ANAVAVGAYYRPNERTMFSIGGSFGSGKNMVNGGVSLKVGSGSVRSMSKAVPAQQLAAQQREIREQRAQIQVLQQRDKDKEAQIQALWQELRQLKKRK
ncbi:MAG: YadA-like family protein, partial [Megasphaera lornae]